MSTPEAQKMVVDLTVAELRQLIRETVAEAVADLIEDPDEGLELSDWAAARLEDACQQMEAGERNTVPLEGIAHRNR